MIENLEKYLYYFLIYFMAVMTSMAFIGIPAMLCYFNISQLLGKGIDVLLIAGIFSAITIIYFGVVEFITRRSMDNRKSILEKMLHICATVGSILLINSIGWLIIILLAGVDT